MTGINICCVTRIFNIVHYIFCEIVDGDRYQWLIDDGIHKGMNYTEEY